MSQSATVTHGHRHKSSGVTMLLYISIVLLTLAVFVADIMTPLGIAVWVLYLLPMGLTLWIWRPSVPIILGGVVGILVLANYLTDTTGIDPAIARVNRVLGLAAIWLLAAVSHIFIRTRISLRRQDWLQTGEAILGAVINGDKRVEELGEAILQFLTDYLGAEAGAFFVKEEGGLRRLATIGVPGHAVAERHNRGEGLMWRAVDEKRVVQVDDVPRGYLPFGSALGRGEPKHILIAPGKVDAMVNSVVEIGLLHPHPDAPALLERIAEMVGVAVRSANYRTNLQDLLEETQRQAEELQTQSEELRVSNEELEAQSRALQESQSRLEQQQAELEQTNSQLEEQAQALEQQRDDLTRAQSDLEARSRDLEAASQYKSEFLANMSHELRTPLNSSLILAKLLADNPEGNLSDEQVRYAETIQSSGNDLLLMINDILDLAKIEAGRMEVRSEAVRVERVADGLMRSFEPIAAQKKLAFTVEKDSACPDTIETDSLRLEQILRNLVSNALKFTDEGEVRVLMSCAGGKYIEFAVADTGIGIAPRQHDAIFEAFRQADSTTSRKYGGTGLGLSISRELARLLGGDIRLESAPGKGSTFTLRLPLVYAGRAETQGDTAPRPMPFIPAAPAAPEELPLRKAVPKRHQLVDDREKLEKGKRTILVVEDDEKFAAILLGLANELGFQCVVAESAEEAMDLTAQYQPHAVILDIGLPDHSGLSVLDRLKQSNRTRHIPVHVVSAEDYTQTAFSLGAAGYMMKPVKREELVRALEHMQEFLSQNMRRVLIVEDDIVQQDSLRKLLALQNVETVAVGTAAECLDKLKEGTYDCMVLDLSLPDASGYSLLETLSNEDAYSFPPVIVYTGRDLSPKEEQQLRRYSRSIIIKGAKSPERLLDEVTLFLHQVVSDLPPEQQKMLKKARNRDATLEGRRILVVEDDIRNIYSLTSIFEPRGAIIEIARNGREALTALERAKKDPSREIDLVLMDVMMPEMDGLTATAEIRKQPEYAKLPVIMLTAKAMKDDQERCMKAGANDYMAKPLDVEKLLSLVRVWMPR